MSKADKCAFAVLQVAFTGCRTERYGEVRIVVWKTSTTGVGWFYCRLLRLPLRDVAEEEARPRRRHL